MIKVKRDKQGVIQTAIKGGALDILEELLNAEPLPMRHVRWEGLW